MRISARAFLLSTLLLSVMAGLLVPDAAAGSTITVFVNFDGKVTGKAGAASFPGNVNAGPTGTQDTISSSSYFEYSLLPNSATGKYTFTGLSDSQNFSLTVNTPFPSGPYTGDQWSTSYTGASGLFVIQMSVAPTTKVTTMTLTMATTGGSAQAKTGASGTLVFTSSTYATTTGTDGGLALPTGMVNGVPGTISSFQTTAGSLTWDPGGIGVSGPSQIIGQQSVPEPSSLVMGAGAIAMCAAGVLISRRKAARALRRSEITPRSCA